MRPTNDPSHRDLEVTRLLAAVQRGDREALDELLPLIYDELHALAHGQRQRWHGDLTMNTTAILHETYVKIASGGAIASESRAHFFSVAARAMRQVLSNYARDRRRKKRGSGVDLVSIPLGGDPVALPVPDDRVEELANLEDALRRLESSHPRQCRVVECRFFGGMSIEDTASALGISPATVKRDWAFARTWLYREIGMP